MPAHYAYILYSKKHDVFYKGATADPVHRLQEHNLGLSRYTSSRGPWEMVYLERMRDKASALKREHQLKKSNRQYLKWVLKDARNILLDKSLEELFG